MTLPLFRECVNHSEIPKVSQEFARIPYEFTLTSPGIFKEFRGILKKNLPRISEDFVLISTEKSYGTFLKLYINKTEYLLETKLKMKIC